MDKYEYLTGEDLGYRPDPVQKGKFEYSPLGQVFNKGLDSDEKQEGLLKKLKNIEDRTDNQLKAIEGQENSQSGLKSIGYVIRDQLPKEAIKTFDNLVEKTKSHTKKYNFDFTIFSSLADLFKQIYYGKILIPAAEREQDEFGYLLDDLKEYEPFNENDIKDKEIFLENIQNFYDRREMVIDAFIDKKIPQADGSYSQYFERKSDEEANIYWIENPDKFEDSSSVIKKG